MVDQLSALQRRLVVAQSRPDEPWLTLVENFPEWPSHATPKERSGAGHGEISPYHYPPSEGLPELREAVALRESAGSTGVLFDAANVLVTAGGLHAIGLAVRHCFADGYRVAVCSRPTFRGVHDSFVSAGLDVCTVDLTGTPEDWPVLDAACVARSVLYLNLPQNPTGIAPTEEFLAMLGHLVRTRDVFLLYDAVYDSFVFERWVCAAPVELAVDLPNVLIANSMSKNYGRPGDRIGWLIGHERTVARLAPRLEWEAVAINGRAQLAAAEIIDNGNTALVDAVRVGRDACRRQSARHPELHIVLPPAGTQLWLDLGVRDIESFADFALAEHHLVLTTSANYVPSPAGHIRYPTGAKPALINAGLDALAVALDQWRDREVIDVNVSRLSTASVAADHN